MSEIMENRSSAEVRNLAGQIRAMKHTIAEEVTAAFLDRHPEWIPRYGKAGLERGIEDAGCHLEYLAAALENRSEELFDDYTRWKRRVMESRGIACDLLRETLLEIGSALGRRLGDGDQLTCGGLIRRAAAICGEARQNHRGEAPAPSLASERGLFLKAVLDGRRELALAAAMEALRAGHTVTEVYSNVIQESLYEIGRLWEENQISVADEHIATAVVQAVLAQLQMAIPRVGAEKGRMMITGVQSELHQIGGMVVAYLLQSRGWNVLFLGSNLPSAAVVRSADRFRPAVIGISATMPFHIAHAREMIGQIRNWFGAGAPRILIGGRAFRSIPDVGEIGADGYVRDLSAAMELLG